MNKKGWIAGALALAMAAPAFACGDGAEGKHAGCPMHVQGAKVSVVKMDSGVVIHVTGGDAATVAKIQAAADKTAAAPGAKGGCAHCAAGRKTAKADAAKAGVYACSMGDYAGAMTKDGKCPKCGMALALKK